MAQPPELPVERGVASPDMLPNTVVKRWQDHLPVHRLENIDAREHVEIARSTICKWHKALAGRVAPLIETRRIDARN